MSVSVDIFDGALPAAAQTGPAEGGGAVLCFEGVVRPSEDDRPITALDYQTYEPMTQKLLRRLAQQALAEFGLIAIHVEHSRGRVRAGETSFRLRITSAHRKEGLAAMDRFIDVMKKEVPIWKRPVFAEAAAGVSR